MTKKITAGGVQKHKSTKRGRKAYDGNGEDVWIQFMVMQRQMSPVAARHATNVAEAVLKQDPSLASSSKRLRNMVAAVNSQRETDKDYREHLDQRLNVILNEIPLQLGASGFAVVAGRLKAGGSHRVRVITPRRRR